jgi:hypothetical protein
MFLLNKYSDFPFYRTTKEQTKDTGIIIALVCLFIAFYEANTNLLIAAIIILFFNLLICNIYKPITILLLNISHILGKLTSPIILFLLYIILILPVGMFRQLMKLDSLSLTQWKKDDLSVFKVREHSYEPKDLNDPY